MSKGVIEPGQLRIWCDAVRADASHRMFVVVRQTSPDLNCWNKDTTQWLVWPPLHDGEKSDAFLTWTILLYSKEVA